MSSNTERKSRLAKAIEEQGRRDFRLDVSHVLCLDDANKPIGEIVFRIPTKRQEYGAIIAAHAKAERLAKEAGAQAETAKSDADLIEELKQTEIIFAACRDADDPTFHAFPSPDWMGRNLDSDQVGPLLRCIEECRKRRGPLPWDFERETILAIREWCVKFFDTEVPELAMAAMDRAYLSSLLVMVMKMWHDETAGANAPQSVEDAPGEAEAEP